MTDTIRKFLDLSTCHLPDHLMNFPLRDIEGVIAYDLPETGCLLWVPETEDIHAATSRAEDARLIRKFNDDEPEIWPDYIPTEIVRIWTHARERDCDYVLFDQDGPVNPDLPQWEW